MDRDPEIHELLQQLNAGDEDVQRDALYHMHQYRADALARPKEGRVEVLQALLKSRLKELLRAAKRDGKV
jgi:hypothetical protein